MWWRGWYTLLVLPPLCHRILPYMFVQSWFGFGSHRELLGVSSAFFWWWWWDLVGGSDHWEQAKKQILDNAPMKLVCRSTTAAPTYLPPVQFTLVDTKADPPRAREFNMVDGGVAVNNPVGFLFMTNFLQFFPKSFSCQCIHICTSIAKNLRGIQLASGLLYQNSCFSFGAQIDPNVQGLFWGLKNREHWVFIIVII